MFCWLENPVVNGQGIIMKVWYWLWLPTTIDGSMGSLG